MAPPAAHAEIQRSLSTKAQELEEELERLREGLVAKDKACEEDAMAQQVALTRAEEERAASVEEQQCLSKKAQELEAEVERLRGELVAKDKAREEDAVTQQVAQTKAEEERAAHAEVQRCLSTKAHELEEELERLRGELAAKDKAHEE